MIKQTVVRTRASEDKYDTGATRDLERMLENDYYVVLATPIGKEIEYILQKDE